MLLRKTKLFNSILKRLFPGLKTFYRHTNSRGFNLIELMIVVAIIGILASVAVPLYMSYIQKSRVRMLVYPGLHVIETNIAIQYATTNKLPDAGKLPGLMKEADTTFFNVNIIGDTLIIIIDSPPEDSYSPMSKMHGMPMYLTPETNDIKISNWLLSGTLAHHLGINSNP